MEKLDTNILIKNIMNSNNTKNKIFSYYISYAKI